MNGQLIAGATSQNYTPTQSGIYVVRITDANGCVYEYSPGYNFTSATGRFAILNIFIISITRGYFKFSN